MTFNRKLKDMEDSIILVTIAEDIKFDNSGRIRVKTIKLIMDENISLGSKKLPKNKRLMGFEVLDTSKFHKDYFKRNFEKYSDYMKKNNLYFEN